MSKKLKDNEITSDDLLLDFRGKGLFPILIFTVLVHGVVLLGSSVPWMMENLFSSVDENASEEKRIQEAVREATGSLRDIADKYGIHPEELSSQFTKKDKQVPTSTTTQVKPETTTPETPVEVDHNSTQDQPKSAIEKEIEVKATGPSLPAIPQQEEEDLFK